MASHKFERHLHSPPSRIEPLPPHSALYRAPPPSQRLDSPPKMRRPMGAQHRGSARYNSTSCLPAAVLEAGLDPAAVDFRNFFPYIPNEVKHRKRTSNDQAKVLESIFDRNTKPDSALRQRLAKELDMSPRGVQVWFQNRRAKEKLIGKKALAAGAMAYKKLPSPKEESKDLDILGKDSQDSQPSPSPQPPSSTTSPSPESSPAHHAHRAIPPELPRLSWSSSQSLSPEMPNHALRQPGPPQAPADLNLRRPSLPAIMSPQDIFPSSGVGSLPPPVNLMARRGSVERLGGNPYARFLLSRVNSYQPRSASLHELHNQACDPFDPSAFVSPDSSRPMLEHRASSMPLVFTGVDMQRRASMPSVSSSTGRMPDRRPYAISSRAIPAPIPGPLPSPNFSFGPPADSPSGSSPVPGDIDGDYVDHISGLAAFSFGTRADDNDAEDDVTSTSYDALSSRFGSIASITGSESSNTSAYYSDVGSCDEFPPDWRPEARRASAPSGQFLDLMSGLDLGRGGHVSIQNTLVNSCGQVPYPSQEELPGAMGAQAESNECSDADGVAYASSASTVSPVRSHGNSPLGKPANVSSQSLPISGSSELAHALQPTHEQAWDGAQSGASELLTTTGLNSAQYNISDVYNMQSSTDSGLVYPQTDSSSSCSSPPETVPKLYVDIDSDHTGVHHDSRLFTQISSTESDHLTPTTGPYSPFNGQDVLELHHAMEYHKSGYADRAIDMSHVTSSLENTLRAPKLYLQYP